MHGEEARREALEAARDAQSAAYEAAMAAREILLSVVLRLAIDVADIAIEHDLQFARKDDEVETADGIMWELHVHYAEAQGTVTIVGRPQRVPIGVASLEELGQVMGASDASFEYAVPLPFLRSALRAGEPFEEGSEG